MSCPYTFSLLLACSGRLVQKRGSEFWCCLSRDVSLVRNNTALLASWHLSQMQDMVHMRGQSCETMHTSNKLNESSPNKKKDSKIQGSTGGPHNRKTTQVALLKSLLLEHAEFDS